eukprot:TRINITY_DN6153_c0_g1_i1.p2 TRINITY_DN6153_c0_g1~~TRINITY_DN6153_c0_g1_i1.p2  ORF type:complete len:148 (-),score=65.75 TRINITY_DN6153_c0_g1_i1:115-495(-)
MLRTGIRVATGRAIAFGACAPLRSIGKGGLGDFSTLLKETTKMMEAGKEQLEKAEHVGTAGAGMVSVTLNGLGRIKAIKIDEALKKDPKHLSVIEDLIMTAHNSAHEKITRVDPNNLGDLFKKFNL